jgi:hypothetical protein
MTELARLRRTYELDALVAPGAGAAWRGAAHKTGNRKDGRWRSVSVQQYLSSHKASVGLSVA